MNTLTLDFETYFSADYTLKHMTMEEYIRDPKFQVICCGINHGEKTKAFSSFPGTIPEEGVGMVCHHAQFDGLILSHHFGYKPAFWFDTLSMGRLLFPHIKSHSLGALAEKLNFGVKSVPYESFINKRAEDLTEEMMERVKAGCIQDVELTKSLFKHMVKLVPRDELKVIDLTIRMYTEPTLLLDTERVRAYLKQEQDKQDDLLGSLGANKTDLRSDGKFAAMLEKLGVEPPTKLSPKTGLVKYAFAKTDLAFTELLESDDEDVSRLCEARLSTKSSIGQTRAGRLLSMGSRGKLPVYLKYAGAHTFRWSGGDKMNFQNLPRGGVLRKSLLAPEGYVLCVADLSQIECRMLAWLAGEQWVLDAFSSGRDLYCEMASTVYGKTVTKADETERFVGKMLVLGAGYGIGSANFKHQLAVKKVKLTDQEAVNAIQSYRQKHPHIVRLWGTADWYLRNMIGGHSYDWGVLQIKGKKIALPNGCAMDYTGLYPEGKDVKLATARGDTKMYGGKFVENITQALARVVMADMMLQIAKRYKIMTTTHDEIVYLAPEREADEAMAFGLVVMKTSPAWAKDLPLNAEGGYDVRYSK